MASCAVGECDFREIVSRFENIARSEPSKVETYIEAQLPKLAKHEVEALTKIIRQYYVKTWKHRTTSKYGHLNKGFDDWQVQAFFRVIDKPKYRLLFGFQANLGFRIGEVIKINLNQIDFKTRELKLRSEKSGRLDSLIIQSSYSRS